MSDLPQTEDRNPESSGLDQMAPEQLVRLLAAEQRIAVDAVLSVSELLARAVTEVAARLRRGGRLHYAGAGTSGRIAFLDASEMPPTFGTDPSLVCAHIAGGLPALTKAIEGAEDDREAGEREIRNHVRRDDAVIGLSASGGAPYVLGAIEGARAAGAWTVGVANTPHNALTDLADLAIVLATGPEPLTGSTRLKAGTSQKILLNTLSTAVMVKLGKVHDNLMIDVVATNSKLRGRAVRLVTYLTSSSEARARELLEAAGGSVKVAVVMGAREVGAAEARRILDLNEGSLRRSLPEGSV